MTDYNPKFPAALKQACATGALAVAQASRAPALASVPSAPTSEPAPAMTTPSSDDLGLPSLPAEPAAADQVRPARKRGRPSNTERKSTPPSSHLGSGYRLGEKIEPKTAAELEELNAMTNRTLLFQRSEKRGGTQWNTVSVYNDGIDIERRTVYQSETGPVWQLHQKLEPTIWNRPVFPVATVLIHSKRAPADPETDPTTERKIRWRGRDYNAADWSEAVVSLSFDSQEIKAQKADSWFPVKESNWTTGLLPWFRVMILNDPATLMRNPTDPAETKPEDLVKLPLEHMWSVTGWCSPNKHAAQNGEVPRWEHITPSHELYAGTGAPYVEPAGDSGLYFEVMRAAMKKRPLLGVFCAMGCGAFAHGLHDDQGREFRGDTSTMVNLYGDGGCGKSTTIQCMTAMIGRPTGGLVVSEATDAGLELTATIANHAFFSIDEMQKHLANKEAGRVIQHLMGLLNGQGKVASAYGGTEIRARRSFDNLILSTANTALAEAINRVIRAGEGHFADALEQRVIELPASEWSPFPSFPVTDPRFRETQGEIKDLMAVLSSTHGHVYAPLIEHYKQNRNAIVNQLRTLQVEFSQRLEARSIMRQVHFFAYTQVGLEALGKVFDLDQETKDAIAAEWNRMVASLSQEAKKAQDVKVDDVIDRIVSWAEANGKHFAVRVSNAKKHKQAYAWPTGKSQADPTAQATAANFRNAQAESHGVWGYFVQDEALSEEGAWTGELWITQAGKEAIENDRVTRLPLLDLLHRIAAKGWVDATTDANGKITRMDKKISNGSYVYRILIGKARADMEAGETPVEAEIPEDTRFDKEAFLSLTDEELGDTESSGLSQEQVAQEVGQLFSQEG